MDQSGLLPSTPERARMFLDLLVLEKALHEIDQELTHRAEWVMIPLRGALRLLGSDLGEPETSLRPALGREESKGT
jgi:predicted trehalose synthase